MATTKKTTAPKKTAAKKTVAKKTTKRVEKINVNKELNNTYLRAILVIIGIVSVIAFVLPFGDLLFDTNLSGVDIIRDIFESMWDAEIGVYPAFFTVVLPAIITIVSMFMMLVLCNKFTAVMSVMLNLVSICLYLVGYSVIPSHMIGWQISFACAVVALMFSIILFVTFPSKKKR